jgi:hypothetical protein
MYDCTQTCAGTYMYLQRNALRDTVICPTAAAKRRARLRQITLPYLTLPDLTCSSSIWLAVVTQPWVA